MRDTDGEMGTEFVFKKFKGMKVRGLFPLMTNFRFVVHPDRAFCKL